MEKNECFDQNELVSQCINNLSNLTLVRLTNNSIYTEDEYELFCSMSEFIRSRLSLLQLVNNLRIKGMIDAAKELDQELNEEGN